jgi:uracil-DNA glycosylase family 4
MPANDDTLTKARRILAQRLESLMGAGVEQFPRAAIVLPGPQALAPQNIQPTLAGPEPAASPPMRKSPLPAPQVPLETPPTALEKYSTHLPTSLAERQTLLDSLNTQVRACTRCRDLACTRQQTVFGVGTAKPRVVFFGEAPGADEDRQGEPFVGRAGQLLTKIIEACGWQRSDVYIMNVLKCRPPENRNPLPAETANCRPFFEQQLEILRPEYIVCVGTVPAQALLKTTEAVGKLRGRFHRYKDSTVLVTYHPSYLLRNPSAKKYVWDDMQTLLKHMGVPVPQRSST